MIFTLILACSSNLEITSNKEQYIVRRSTEIFPLNEQFSFAFELFNASDDPVTPEEVVVDAEMPAHGHGMGQTPTVSNTNNAYTADGMLFAMEGDWDIHIYMTLDGAVDQATYSVVCCE